MMVTWTRRIVLLPLLFSWAIRSVCAQDLVDFHNDLIPLFTKHGCNAGACHGAAIGRGGFKLSLYGGDPSADYREIVQQLEGRRINLADPETSLVVLKPTEQMEHGGGRVFDFDDESARLLIDWIQQGARVKPQRQLVRVDISPRYQLAEIVGDVISLRATAYYSDDSKRDVTRWTIFKAEDSTAVSISNGPTSASATVNRRGRHIVVARYLSEVVPIEIIVPLTDAPLRLTDGAQDDLIDVEILQTLTTLGLPPSPTIDDAAFLRRVTLDLTGRIPTPDQAQAVLDGAGNGNSAAWRVALIDRLLASPEFTEYWTFQLAKLLRVRPQQQDTAAAVAYHTWLTEQVQTDVSYRQFAATLIVASGDSHVEGPANFYRTVLGPSDQAEFMSELFLGSRLRCANCHNHPLDRWTQDDYHGLAAIFAKVEGDTIVKPNPRGLVIHPRTLEPAVQRIPGEMFLPDDEADGRRRLAEWLTGSDNPYFAKAIVNRLWKQMMGRGLVEPVDDFRATNPATHPNLLTRLADDFVAHDYRLRHTLREIATSQAYARSANANRANKHDDQFYSHAIRRRLEPEVLADAIADVLGVAEAYADQPEWTRAISLVDPATPSVSLDILGRCGRQASCESNASTTGPLPQRLHLFNGNLLNARISADGSQLRQLLAAGVTPVEIVDRFYVVALGRRPTEAEQQHWSTQLDALLNDDDRRSFLEDFVWGLTTCDEFVTNH